jgi:hypothetical protein
MKRLSAVLMGLGVALGAGVSAAMLLHLGIPGLHWLILVGLAKLTLAGSLGLIAVGAFLRRLAIRAEQREIAAGTTESHVASRRTDTPR